MSSCLARVVVSWFAFVVAIFIAHENGDKQRPAEGRRVQGMLDETDPLREESSSSEQIIAVVLHAVLEDSP